MALTRLTVNLIPAAANAITVAVEHTLDSKTDVVNRALQLYRWWLEQEVAGREHFVRMPDGAFYKADLKEG